MIKKHDTLTDAVHPRDIHQRRKKEEEEVIMFNSSASRLAVLSS